MTKKPTKSIMVAIDKSRGIGKDGDLLFKISDDLKRFKKITLGHPVIMGRKTFESIGRPLPKRTNIVLSRSKQTIPGCLAAGSLGEAVDMAEKLDREEIFFIGGESVYRDAMPQADKIYLTKILKSVPADVFFPDYSQFRNQKKVGEGEEGGIEYEYWEMKR